MRRIVEFNFGLPSILQPGNDGKRAERTADEVAQLASILKVMLSGQQNTPVDVAGLTATPNAFNAILSDMPTVEPSITTPPTVDCNEDSESTAQFFEPKPRTRFNANAFVDGSTDEIRQQLRIQRQRSKQVDENDFSQNVVLDSDVPLYRDDARVSERTTSPSVVVQVTPPNFNQQTIMSGYKDYPIDRQLSLLKAEMDAYPKTGRLPDVRMYSEEVVSILDEFMKSKTSTPVTNPANKANYTFDPVPALANDRNITVHAETSSGSATTPPAPHAENEASRQPEKSRIKLGGLVLRLVVMGALGATGYVAYTTTHDWTESAAKETCEAYWAMCAGKGLVDVNIPNIPDIPSIQSLISQPKPPTNANTVQENKVPEEKR